MSTNQYRQGTVEYKQKQKVIEVQIRGFTDVESDKRGERPYSVCVYERRNSASIYMDGGND